MKKKFIIGLTIVISFAMLTSCNDSKIKTSNKSGKSSKSSNTVASVFGDNLGSSNNKTNSTNKSSNPAKNDTNITKSGSNTSSNSSSGSKSSSVSGSKSGNTSAGNSSSGSNYSGGSSSSSGGSSSTPSKPNPAPSNPTPVTPQPKPDYDQVKSVPFTPTRQIVNVGIEQFDYCDVSGNFVSLLDQTLKSIEETNQDSIESFWVGKYVGGKYKVKSVNFYGTLGYTDDLESAQHYKDVMNSVAPGFGNLRYDKYIALKKAGTTFYVWRMVVSFDYI